MTETRSSIDSLTQIDYSIDPRRVINYRGETAGLVLMNSNDPQDMQRVRRIEREAIDSNPIFARGKNTDKKLIDWVKRDGVQGKWENGEWKQTYPNEWPGIPLGVVGLDKVEQAEKGELIGWVQFYPPDANEERYAQYRKEGILPATPSPLPMVEISYGKLPDAPSGHMASGLRQACLELSKSLVQTDDFKQNERSSEIKPSLEIVAYVATDNINSIRVLEASAFERKTELHGGKLEEFFYTLNWDKLHEIVQEKADTTLPKPSDV